MPLVPTTRIGAQSGMALIFSLVILMVLTMVAVVAMRTTTLDLKITTNQTMKKRSFQSSEAARSISNEVVGQHTFHRGWPASLSGGTVPASTGFTIPTGMSVDDPAGELYLSSNNPWDLTVNPGDVSHQRDLMFTSDTDSDGTFIDPLDMDVNIFVTRVGSVAAPGSDTSQVSGYSALGQGAAAAGALLFYDFRSQSISGGGAATTTASRYRHVVTN
ncbi:MAG: PilX N-terminal domain-containing pilus assembly protein [Pseudomonadota bacterium]